MFSLLPATFPFFSVLCARALLLDTGGTGCAQAPQPGVGATAPPGAATGQVTFSGTLRDAAGLWPYRARPAFVEQIQRKSF